MCDHDGDGYVDERFYPMIRNEFKYNNSSKKIGQLMMKLSRKEFIENIENKEFIKELNPFSLEKYFKNYEGLIDIQSNDVGNLAKIIRA